MRTDPSSRSAPITSVHLHYPANCFCRVVPACCSNRALLTCQPKNQRIFRGSRCRYSAAWIMQSLHQISCVNVRMQERVLHKNCLIEKPVHLPTKRTKISTANFLFTRVPCSQRTKKPKNGDVHLRNKGVRCQKSPRQLRTISYFVTVILHKNCYPKTGAHHAAKDQPLNASIR
jgi:hypothetical protein